MKALRLLPHVLEDVAQAARWYDEEGHIGLGARFVSVFYSSLQHIQQDGQIYRVVYRGFRRVILNPFPYALYYRYYRQFVVITLVIHAARNPKRVKRLLRERRVL